MRPESSVRGLFMRHKSSRSAPVGPVPASASGGRATRRQSGRGAEPVTRRAKHLVWPVPASVRESANGTHHDKSPCMRSEPRWVDGRDLSRKSMRLASDRCGRTNFNSAVLHLPGTSMGGLVREGRHDVSGVVAAASSLAYAAREGAQLRTGAFVGLCGDQRCCAFAETRLARGTHAKRVSFCTGLKGKRTDD